MDLRSLRYFVATIEAGTVSGAAQRCHIAQPSISNAISQLEGEFNKVFFVRQAKGMEPTDAGMKFYQQAKALLIHADEMHRHVMQAETQAHITLYVPPTVSSSWLAEWWRDLQALDSGYRWVLVSDAAVADVSLQVYTDNREASFFFQVQEQSYYLLCHAGNPLCYAREIHWNDVAEQPLIERRYCELRDVFLQFCTHSATPLNIVAQVDNEDWAMALVSAGVGLTFAPLGTQVLPERIVAIPLTRIAGVPPHTRRLGLSVRAQHPRVEALVALCEQMVDLLKHKASAGHQNAGYPNAGKGLHPSHFRSA